MLTPFLFELRALMDWIWTDSSMPLFEWLKMEDIFAKIFELKVTGLSDCIINSIYKFLRLQFKLS